MTQKMTKNEYKAKNKNKKKYIINTNHKYLQYKYFNCN